MAPTLAMSFNVSLAVQFAGPAAPLAFIIGTIAIFVIGLSFVAWSRRVAHAGSAYGYITRSLGKRWGFMAGWTLMLTYIVFGAGTAALVGNFLDAAARTSGLHLPAVWLLTSAGGILLSTLLARRNMHLAGRMMLLLEGISLTALVTLALIIVIKLSALHALSWQPFVPSSTHRGWAGVGYAMVFAVLSFGGFEAAATLGEETRDPHRNIPIAILGTLVLAGALYVLISYAQVIGFGLPNSAELAHDPAPLDTLALRFVSRGYAVTLDLAAALGAFCCVLGNISAAGRLLFALGRAGLVPASRRIPQTTIPNAIVISGAISLLCILLGAPKAGPGAFYGDLGTIGTLALILVYMGVAWAQAKEAALTRYLLGIALGVAGVLLLIWPLYNSVYPVPAYPDNLWPLVLLGWLVCGGALLLTRPALARHEIADIISSESISSESSRGE